MISIEAIVRPERVSHVCEAMAKAGCKGFYYTNVTGQGQQGGVEVFVGRGGQMARAAGTYVQLIGKDSGYAQLRLTSGELRIVPAKCMATVGAVSNSDNKNTNLSKAGRNRWLGKRPKVRGVAMNPVDHPHGGGEGRTSGGRHPVTPWGVPTKGKRTRGKKPSDKYIMRRRNKR